ncbi:acyl carrier protein phosphodiesterase [Salinimicrobium tongyeongense]|jgi:acyl carrier protein phosphodiesterase|uniref:Acyl carrier protein phosphodiesterase n=1 Tax=Salinimicrobium tongyeongense TaxID=2809707 RepID=A0ABY6NSC4_9FLAO|nr:acyl carrier protein phosphodiesterase [Salinimicrobium tongyeongense]UZH55556.1 acyl carrier protein phosphodiesterase [Salinimicrobium tongyeongense]
MNFLAHIYLSGDNDDICLGNFIADSIKGKKYLEFPSEVQKGVLLHRAIDSYTDSHPIVRKSTAKLHKNYSHYSGVIVDIFYDHFLASRWEDYSEVPLENFVADFYKLLKQRFEVLPAPIQNFLPYMVSENWLLSYASIEGIARILYQMNLRTKNIVRMDRAVNELKEYYEEFSEEFTAFFPQLQEYSHQQVSSL